jgi:hypothetical protein
VYVHVALDDRVPDGLRPLLDQTTRLLKAIKAGYRKLRTFRASASRRAPFFVTGKKIAPLMSHPSLVARREREKKLEVAVNRDHEHFKSLVRLQQRSPKLAAFCLARALLLNEDRLLDSDVGMMAEALQRGKA